MKINHAALENQLALQPVNREELHQVEGGVAGIAIGLGLLVASVYASRYIGPMEHRILEGIKAPKT